MTKLTKISWFTVALTAAIAVAHIGLNTTWRPFQRAAGPPLRLGFLPVT